MTCSQHDVQWEHNDLMWAYLCISDPHSEGLLSQMPPMSAGLWSPNGSGFFLSLPALLFIKQALFSSWWAVTTSAFYRITLTGSKVSSLLSPSTGSSLNRGIYGDVAILTVESSSPARSPSRVILSTKERWVYFLQLRYRKANQVFPLYKFPGLFYIKIFTVTPLCLLITLIKVIHLRVYDFFKDFWTES